MTTKKITTAGAVLAAIGVIGYEVNKANRLESELQAVRAEQTQATDAVRDLKQQITTLKTQLVAPTNGTPPVASGNPAAVVKPAAPDAPGITRKAPSGWHKNGSNPNAYDVGVDQLQTWGGMPSAYVKSIGQPGDKGFGGMMQTTSADAYKNQRVKLTGWVKTENAIEGGHLWLRIDGRMGTEPLGFDNMNGRAPTGTTDWQEYSAVLDVPSDATTINYGFFVQGSGQMWVNGVTIQRVGAEVPSTNMISSKRELPKTPVNLGFDAN